MTLHLCINRGHPAPSTPFNAAEEERNITMVSAGRQVKGLYRVERHSGLDLHPAFTFILQRRQTPGVGALPGSAVIISTIYFLYL